MDSDDTKELLREMCKPENIDRYMMQVCPECGLLHNLRSYKEHGGCLFAPKKEEEDEV